MRTVAAAAAILYSVSDTRIVGSCMHCSLVINDIDEFVASTCSYEKSTRQVKDKERDAFANNFGCN